MRNVAYGLVIVILVAGLIGVIVYAYQRGGIAQASAQAALTPSAPIANAPITGLTAMGPAAVTSNPINPASGGVPVPTGASMLGLIP